jgi:gas vesicle protein
MGKLTLTLLLACGLLGVNAANAQDDSPSLGDVARQARQQKQLKDAQAAKQAQASATAASGAQAADASNAQAAKPSKTIITNDEIPAHVGTNGATEPRQMPADPPLKGGAPAQGEQVRTQIVQLKGNIASLQSQITDLEQSIHYTGNNCVYGCAQWNENQQKKQEQVETLKQQLAQQQENLDQAQETARKQGYGSSVYDPE